MNIKNIHSMSEIKVTPQNKEYEEYYEKYGEGNGRAYHAGGVACDYCPHCYGNSNWCPLLD